MPFMNYINLKNQLTSIHIPSNLKTCVCFNIVCTSILFIQKKIDIIYLQ